MNRTRIVCSIALGSLAVCTSILFAQDAKKQYTKSTPPTKPAVVTPVTPPEAQLPPGMTEEMMQDAMSAGTPGPMQAYLCENAGEWAGACSTWMAPNTPAMITKSMLTVTPILGGRFVQQQTKGDMGEWGPFEGFSLTGYDNAKGEFQAYWADTMGTGMMYGTGELSSDKKVLTINYNYNCPIQKKSCAYKQTVTHNDNGTQTLRMWGPNLGTGEEYKMMEIVYARTSAPAVHAEHTDSNHIAH